jgi:hypothetical protein
MIEAVSASKTPTRATLLHTSSILVHNVTVILEAMIINTRELI